MMIRMLRISNLNRQLILSRTSCLEPRAPFLAFLHLSVRRGLECVFAKAWNSCKEYNFGQNFSEKIKVPIGSVGKKVKYYLSNAKNLHMINSLGGLLKGL